MKLPKKYLGKKLWLAAASLMVVLGVSVPIFAYNLQNEAGSKTTTPEQPTVEQTEVGQAEEASVATVPPPAEPEDTEPDVSPSVPRDQTAVTQDTKTIAKDRLYALWDKNDRDDLQWECFDFIISETTGYGNLEDVTEKMNLMNKNWVSFCAAHGMWKQYGKKPNLYPLLYGTDRSKYVW